MTTQLELISFKMKNQGTSQTEAPDVIELKEVAFQKCKAASADVCCAKRELQDAVENWVNRNQYWKKDVAAAQLKVAEMRVKRSEEALDEARTELVTGGVPRTTT